MSKIVDDNGFWIIKKNPISKEGVFPYLGHTISADCEPNKVYKVYRSGETLKESVPTWDNPPKPFIEDHEMLGEGFTAVDDRHVQGVISNPVYEDGVLYADIAVYSESLKESIENGKKELSLGYFCKYRKESGVFDGEEYDYVQEDMVGNHIALVDAGRCGSDVKVFDSRCTMDKLDIGLDEDDNLALKKNEESGNIEETGTTVTKDETMAKYVLVSEVNAILKEAFKWGDGEIDPKADLIAKLLDAKSVEGVLPTTDEDDSDEEKEKKAEDKCGKDEDDSEEKEDKKTEDEDDSEEEKKDKAEDADEIADIKAMIAEIKAMLKSKSEDEDETKESEKEKETEDEDESKEDDKKESEDEDESKEDKKSSEDSAIWGFGQDGADSDEDEAFANYLK